MRKENINTEKKYTVFKFLLGFALILMCLSKFSIVSNAATTVKSGTIKVEANSFYEIFFNLPKSGVVSIDMEISLEKNRVTSSKDKFTILLGEPYEKADIIGDYQDDLLNAKNDIKSIIEKDSDPLESGLVNATFFGCYYCPNVLNKGEYVYQFQNHSIHKYTIKYKIYEYSNIATSFSTTSVNVTAGKEKVINLKTSPSDAFLGVDEIKVSSKKLEFYFSGNDIYVFCTTPGTYKMTVKLYSGYSKTITVNVKKPNKLKLRYKSYTMYTGESFKNALISTSKSVKWSSSNKKVATVNQNGKVTAKGVGSAKITAKVGSKKYVCTVKVKRAAPNFYAKVTGYNRSKNYFTVKFVNKGTRSVTIYSTGSKALHNSNSSYNRSLSPNNGSKTVIQPGKSKTLKFYVKGSKTWSDYKNFTIEYRFKHDGKKYTGHVWYEDSSYKKSGSWYTTYYDVDAFANWIN